MTKAILIVSAVVVVGATAVGGIFLHQKDVQAPTTLPSDTYTATAVTQSIVQSVSATGPVASNLDVAIKCRAYGEVTILPFDISDRVKKDQLLVQLDTKDEEVALKQAEVALAQAKSKLTEAIETEKMGEFDLNTATEQAEANVVSAQVSFDNLQKKAERQKELLGQNLASPEDYETAQTNAAQAQDALKGAIIAKEELKSQAVALQVKQEDVKLAQQQVQLDQIDVDNAQQQKDYCTITAPMDGIISDLQIQLGTIISSAISNVGGGTSVLTLSDMSHIFVLASVDESDIGGVRVGQKVNVTADAYPGREFSGKVVRIATTGVNTNNVVTFEAKIEVTSEDKNLLKPQMTGNVEIVEAKKDNVVTVPMLAIIRKQHKTFVTVVHADGSTEDREVRIGIDDGENQEITLGLSEGENVLVHRNESTSVWSAANIVKRMPGAGMPGGRH